MNKISYKWNDCILMWYHGLIIYLHNNCSQQIVSLTFKFWIINKITFWLPVCGCIYSMLWLLSNLVNKVNACVIQAWLLDLLGLPLRACQIIPVGWAFGLQTWDNYEFEPGQGICHVEFIIMDFHVCDAFKVKLNFILEQCMSWKFIRDI